jgi:hypothetical protein
LDDANRGVRPAGSDSAAGRSAVQAPPAAATMTGAEGLMAIRVLATFPELPSDPPVAVPDDRPTARGFRAPADAAEPAEAPPVDAADPGLRPVVSPAPRRPRRVRPRASFPGASVAALAVVAAAVWSLIAIREAKRPAADAVRLAAEVAEGGAAETAIR